MVRHFFAVKYCMATSASVLVLAMMTWTSSERENNVGKHFKKSAFEKTVVDKPAVKFDAEAAHRAQMRCLQYLMQEQARDLGLNMEGAKRDGERHSP